MESIKQELSHLENSHMITSAFKILKPQSVENYFD